MIINVHEAKARLSELLSRAQNGEEIVIAKRNRPIVRLTLVEEAERAPNLGWGAGLCSMADDFDAPIDDFDGYQ